VPHGGNIGLSIFPHSGGNYRTRSAYAAMRFHFSHELPAPGNLFSLIVIDYSQSMPTPSEQSESVRYRLREDELNALLPFLLHESFGARCDGCPVIEVHNFEKLLRDHTAKHAGLAGNCGAACSATMVTNRVRESPTIMTGFRIAI
jgi:hypothetical protein